MDSPSAGKESDAEAGELRRFRPLLFASAVPGRVPTDRRGHPPGRGSGRWWRRLRRREWLTSRLPERADGTDHSGDVARRDSVMRSLRRLTHRERAVVVLRYFVDLTEQDTAAELGISLGTVKSTNARALAKLRVSPDLSRPSIFASTTHGEN
jgi:DNA-binding CsgD family transcriptional regulator